MDYGFNIFIRFGFGFGLEIDNGSGWFSNLYYLTDSELDLDSVLPSGRVGLWIQYIYRIWIWVWIQYYSQVGLDYGFNIFIGFGFGFGFINPLKSESESVNPNLTTTTQGPFCKELTWLKFLLYQILTFSLKLSTLPAYVKMNTVL